MCIYFEYIINSVMNNEKIDYDWVGTISNGAVQLTEVNESYLEKYLLLSPQEVSEFSFRRDAEHEHRVYPLRIYISTQTGREYLLAYHYRFRKPMFFRLDAIRSIKAGPLETRHEQYESFAVKFDENLWGVSTGGEYNIDHVELTLSVGDGEGYVLDRLEREKRHGRIEALDAHTYKFVADVYDAGELLTWARSFLGRVIRFESSNKFAVQRFYDDIRRMETLYERGEAE